MTGRFLIKEIALQAGVSTATVDRVLNDRGGVRERTVARVRHAIAELEHQGAWTAVRGQRFVIDILVEAPRIFLNVLRAAMDEEIAMSRLGVFQLRRDMRPAFPADEMARTMHQIARRGSDGVIVMGPVSDLVREAIAALDNAGVPVITLTTDIPGSARRAYVGLDNHRAGMTAAWFMRKWVQGGSPHVIVTMRNLAFRGENERRDGFVSTMHRHFDTPKISVLVESPDRRDIAQQVRRTLVRSPEVCGFYSVGGSNLEILDAVRGMDRTPGAYVAHDLDDENLDLMRRGRIDVLIYHDLREDVRNALRSLMSIRSKGRIPPPPDGAALRVMVPPMCP